MKTSLIALALFASAAVASMAHATETAPAASPPPSSMPLVGAPEDLGMRPDHHRPGHRFCIGGMGSPEELATKVDNALKANGKGITRLAGCRAKPVDLLLSFQKLDPKAGLTKVAQLPAYLRKLVPANVDRNLQFASACLREPFHRGYPDTVELGCGSRTLEKGETIYMNPDTNVNVLQSACVNPGGTPSALVFVTATDCIEVRYPVYKGKPVRDAFMGRHQLLSNKCGPVLFRNGDNVGTRKMPEECPKIFDKIIDGQPVRVVCDWKDDEAVASQLLGYQAQVQDLSFSYVAEADGIDRVILPKEALDGEFAICYEKPDGVEVAVGVRKQHYREGTATITREYVDKAVYQR